jgi:ACS family glucarate transporter-like MFS transporter
LQLSNNAVDAKSNVRWLLVFWMFLMGAIAYLDRVNISIAGQAVAAEFHLSNQQLGGIFSAFIAGYAVFQTPGGWLADRFGARIVLTLGVLWWGFFTSLITVISPNIAAPVLVLVVIRFVLGMGEAVVYPASNCVVAAWVPSEERGIANGLIFAGTGFGAGITPPLVAYLLVHYGWRSSFWVSSLLGLAAGLGWYFIARDQPSQHPWVRRAELSPSQSLARKPAVTDWGAILRNRNLIAVTFSYFCYGYEAYIFFSWFFIYLNSARGLDLKKSSYYGMLPFLAMAVASPLGGWISDRISRRFGKRAGRSYFSAAAIGFSAVFLVLGMMASTPELASIVLAGGAGALYLSQSCFWSMSADIGKGSAGSVSGVMNMGGQIGGAITASLTPALASHFGWTTPFLVAAGLTAAGALAWLPVKPD